jgi:hypothetical protein
MRNLDAWLADADAVIQEIEPFESAESPKGPGSIELAWRELSHGRSVTNGEGVRWSEIDTVGIVEVAKCRSWHPLVAVLPNDAVGAGIDHDHPVVVIVVGKDVAVGKRKGEGGLVERLGSVGLKAPQQLAG